MFDWLKNVSKEVKELNSAVNSYKEETNNQSIPTVAYINQAKKLIEQSRFIEAKEALAKALMISDKDALIYKYIGICEERTGNLQQAEQNYKKSAEINPQDKSIWHKLGMVQIALRDYETAQKTLEIANKVAPMNTDILTAWGMSMFKQKNYQQALEKFTDAMKINRYNFSAMLLSAITEVRLGKYDDADKKFNFLLSANPNESCTYEYANLCFLKENYTDAIHLAKKSIEYNPNMLPAYMLLGKIYSINYDYENSVMYFTKAVEKGLASPILYIEWANALVRLCEFTSAMEMYQNVLLQEKDCIEAVDGLMLCYAELSDSEKASQLIPQVSEKLSDSENLITTQALLKMNEKQFDEAVNLFKTVLNKNPKNVYMYYHLARCYENLGNDDMIKDSYDKLIKFNEIFTRGYLQYAKYLISKNDYKSAQLKLRKAQKLAPENQEILNLLFFTSYKLVKENLCEYNIKEAISIANSIEKFDYPEQKAELEDILKNIKK